MTIAYVPPTGLFFIDSDEYIAPCGVFFDTHYQYVRPNADNSNSGWVASSGSDLYAMLDESTADDADYIYTYTDEALVKLDLENPALPTNDYDHVLRVRCKGNGDTGLSIMLYEGATLRWSDYVVGGLVPATPTTLVFRIPASDVANITDYTALRLHIQAIVGG